MFEHLTRADERMFLWATETAQRHGLQSAARFISWTGDGPFYLYIAFGFVVFDPSGLQLFNLAIASYLIELPLYFALKNSIRRTRPCHLSLGIDSIFEPSDKFSLPSGHTAAAFVMASCIVIVFPSLMWIALAWALAIGLSRVVLAVHFPLDIVAGIALGVASVNLAQFLFF